MPSLVENVPGFGEEDFKRFQYSIFTILQLSPPWKGSDPSFEKKNLESSSPKDDLCQACYVKVAPHSCDVIKVFWKT